MRVLTTIFLFLLPVLAPGQLTSDLRIVDRRPGSVTIEYSPVVAEQSVASAGGERRIRFHVLAGAQDTLAGPAFPQRRIPFLLSTSRILVTVLDAAFTDRVVAPLLSEPGSSQAILSPASVVEIAQRPGSMLAIVALRPAIRQSDGSVRVFDRLLVKIEFDQPSPGGDDPTAILRGDVERISNVDRTMARVAADDSPLAQGEWYRIDITEDGIYRLDQDFFRRSNISSTAIAAIRNVRIFGNGGRVLPEVLTSPRPDNLKEVPRVVVDVDGDGVFDPEDYLLFHGRSTRGWTYNAPQQTFRHFIHPYTERNTYFITFGNAPGRDMDSIPSLPTSGILMRNDFPEHLFTEQEKANLVKSGRRWVGDAFDYLSNSRVYTNLLPGLDTTAAVMYRYVVLSHSATVDTFTVAENDRPLGSPLLMYTVDVSPSNNAGTYAYVSSVDAISRTGNIPNNRSILKFHFGTRNQAAIGWLDWFEIHYRRRLEAVGDFLQFTAPDTAGAAAFTVRGLSSRNVVVFDVTDDANVRRVTSLEEDAMDPTICRFAAVQTAGAVRQYAVAGLNGFKTPAAAARVPNSNIRGFSRPVDFVIIAPTDFLSEAERLRAHREAFDTLASVVVDLQQIYNEFSGGLQDPMAIRDFLGFTQRSWPRAPRYVLLFGGGHYDYKNATTSAPNWIPPYESVESIYQINSYTSDDYFVFLNPNDARITMRIGRLPARNRQEAKALVDKIITYETDSPFDQWRNRITFVADDGLTSNDDDLSIHTSQADRLATLYTPGGFDKQKIYLVEFPTVMSAVGRRKPDVNRAIVEAINAGTVIINYTGHGNERLWAHEAVFTREDDLPKLVNRDRLTFLVGATCNYAQYDDPVDQSSGEIILVMPGGGAIAAVSAARAVYSGENAQLNEILYGYLFPRDALGRPPRIGDAMFAVKQILKETNALKYHLFGDPTLRLAMPRSPATIDSVNGSATASLATIPTLGRIRIEGSIRKPDNSPWNDFNGRAIVQLYDAQQIIRVPLWGSFQYTVSGSTLYRGEVSVSAGRFSTVIPVPKDVSFGGNSRVGVYAWSGTTDAVGYTENVRIAGIDTTAAVDTTGPQIGLFVDDLSFQPGDPVSAAPTLIVRLQDESGINTSSVGIGHRLEARLVDPPQAFDLSESYRSDLDTYRSGEARAAMTDLRDGSYEVHVKAWDIHNNSSDASTVFRVRASGALSLERVMNYPNPAAGATTFSFLRAGTDPLDVTLKIYTIAGRMIQVLEQRGTSDRLVTIPWDGRDADGDEIGNGVYFYRIMARTIDGTQSAEAIGKLAVVR